MTPSLVPKLNTSEPMNLQEAAEHIVKCINNRVKRRVEANNVTADLQKVLRQLIALLPDPNDEAAQRNMVEQICASITLFEYSSIEDMQLSETHRVAKWCIEAAQISGMSGKIPFKYPFKMKPFNQIFSQQYKGPFRYQWESAIEARLKSSRMYQIELLLSIHTNNRSSMSTVLKSAQTDGVKLDLDKALELAFQLRQDDIVHRLMLEKHRNIHKIFAQKMLSLIRSVDVEITKGFFSPPEGGVEKLLEDQLSQLIMDMLTHELLHINEFSISEEKPSLLMKSYEDNIGDKVRTSLILDASYSARSEIQTVYNVLHTILDRLKCKTVRNAFLDKDAPSKMNVGLLCMLAFNLAIHVGSLSNDDSHALASYRSLYNFNFPSMKINQAQCVAWQCRLLNLMNVMKSYQAVQADPFEPAPENNADIPLTRAIAKKMSIDFIEQLIKSSDINALDDQGYAPLHAAIKHGNLAAFDLLLAQPNINISVQDANFHTCMWIAVMYNRIDYVPALLERKIVLTEHDVHCVNKYGYSLLCLSLAYNIQSLPELLIKNNIDWTKKDYNGNTVLHTAFSSAPATARLILFRAPMSRYALAMKNLNGKTPADLIYRDAALVRDTKMLLKFYPHKK